MNIAPNYKNLAFSALTGLALTASSQGALILGTSIESATTGLNAAMSPQNAINGSGLPGEVPALTGSHDESFDNNWWTGWDAGVTEWQITVDLEANYDLDTVQIWNYREGCCAGRGLKDVSIWVAPDEDENNLVQLMTDGTGLHDDGSGGFTLPLAPTGGTYDGFNLDLSSVTNAELLENARLFRIDGGSSIHETGQVHAGLAEIQFGGVAAIPEPTSAALALLGFAGMITRRSRKA